jgi:hypothetical protein
MHMKQNVKIASELLKLAKELTAMGDAYHFKHLGGGLSDVYISGVWGKEGGSTADVGMYSSDKGGRFVSSEEFKDDTREEHEAGKKKMKVIEDEIVAAAKKFDDEVKHIMAKHGFTPK